MRSSARQGGAVRRYHTWPVHRQQTVAEHSWNVARIVTTIWPVAPASVIMYCLYHDVGEIATGDIPFPVKAENPELKGLLDQLEDRAVEAMRLPPHHVDDIWRRRVKVCDLIEMWEFGIDEELMGNVMALPIIDRTIEKVRDLIGQMTSEERGAIINYLDRHREWQHTMQVRRGKSL